MTRWDGGLLCAFVMILGSTAPAFGEAQPTPDQAVETVAPAAETDTAASTAQTSSSTDGVGADADAADQAAPDPDRYPQLDVPTKPWAYDTDYFFALTRGLRGEQLSTWCRRTSMVGTVPIDVVGLPAAALSGLFGS